MTQPSDSKKPQRKSRTLRIAGIIILVVAIGIAVNGILSRRQDAHKLTQWTNAQAVPTVAVVHAKPETGHQILSLPGTIFAFYKAPIYARVDGYLKMWYQDIGAHVKAGQLLAVIDTPELDEQLNQAKADLQTSIANEHLAVVTARRWQKLLTSNSVSQQATDQYTSDAAAKQAQVVASQANVARLEALEVFKRVVAPFDGVVTARNTDVGALINAGSGHGAQLFSGSGTDGELFAVSDVSRMRVYVQVPQAYSAQISIGMHAQLVLPQFPGQTFDAQVNTTAASIQNSSRSVLVELLVANPDEKLWPGNFAQVRFDLPNNSDVLLVPSTTLVFQRHGLQVAVVGPNDTVEMKDIRPGRDLGTEMEVLSGITAEDKIIDNPLGTLSDGEKVAMENTTPQTEQVASQTPAEKAKP